MPRGNVIHGEYTGRRAKIGVEKARVSVAQSAGRNGVNNTNNIQANERVRGH